jgi:ABC-type sugar transport system ATPase subunit
MTTPILRINNISKTFPGVKALDDVSFDVHKGEVHVLMGENGAGKSTLMKILSGAYQPDAGLIELDGQAVSISDPIHSQQLGISMIYQELTVLDNLDVGRNIMLGQEPKAVFGQVDWKELYQRADKVLEELELPLDARTPLENLNIAERQMVEIARAVQRNPRLVIMDEPTSSLGKHEEEVLFSLIARLKAKGVSIIYISHRMEEVFRLADRITVLRDGKHIATDLAKNFSKDRLIVLMVGRKVEAIERGNTGKGKVILEIKNLSKNKRLHDVSFQLHAGEVLGIAGLVGAGQTELAQILFGADKADTGEVWLNGQRLHLRTPQDAISQGIAYVPEDRKGLGLVLMMDVQNNMSLATLKENSSLGVLNFKQLREGAKQWVDKLKVRTSSLKKSVEELSGGNQQKVVLAKWLALGPKVFILNEPTRGVDVGAKTEVHKLIREIASQGVAVLMISSELPEVLSVSDRILVMWQGRITADLEAKTATEQNVLTYAFGEAA